MITQDDYNHDNDHTGKETDGVRNGPILRDTAANPKKMMMMMMMMMTKVMTKMMAKRMAMMMTKMMTMMVIW